jgi:hypothetical protein
MNEYSYIVPEIIALDGKQTQYHEVAELVIAFGGSVALETRTKFSGDNSSTFASLYGVELAYPLGYGLAAMDVARLRRDMSVGGSIAVLIDRIITGFDRKRVGSNWRGTMTADAAEASDELTALVADDAYVNDEVWVENVVDTECSGLQARASAANAARTCCARSSPSWLDQRPCGSCLNG